MDVLRTFFCIRRGITLIEAVVYVGLLGLIAVFVAGATLSLVDAYAHARAEQEVISNGRLLLETLTRSIAEAEQVYSPTSRFHQDAGQLSLVTATGALSEHTTSYEDFWVDNGVMLMRHEGKATTTLSANSVRVAVFRIERTIQGISREAVTITLTVNSSSPKYPASITLHAMAQTRGSY